MASSYFSTYLVPSLPFRRRQSSSASSASSSSPPLQSYLSNNASNLRCSYCLTDLAFASQIVSKGFTGRHGRAYLVAPSSPPSSLANLSMPATSTNARTLNAALPDLPNTTTRRPVPRQLVTGNHTVSDIHCRVCGLCLGWKYVAAEEESQQYKVGKFILEEKRVCREVGWALSDVDEGAMGAASERRRRRSSANVAPDDIPKAKGSAFVEEDVEFNSQDEDECEALFSGTWTPQMAAEMRKAKNSIARVDE